MAAGSSAADKFITQPAKLPSPVPIEKPQSPAEPVQPDTQAKSPPPLPEIVAARSLEQTESEFKPIQNPKSREQVDTQSDEEKSSQPVAVPTLSPDVAQPPAQAGGLTWVSRGRSGQSTNLPALSNPHELQPTFSKTNAIEASANPATPATTSTQSETKSIAALPVSVRSDASQPNELGLSSPDSVNTNIAFDAGTATQSRLTADSNIPNRFQLASRISHQIRGSSEDQRSLPVQPSRNVVGWDAIAGRLTTHMQKCDDLSRRGAFLSARDEANQALVKLARHLDQLTNQFVSEPHLDAARIALRESGDFANSQPITDAETLKEIVHSHDTPILKRGDFSQVSPLTIAEHYRTYSQYQLTQAAQGHPWFSDIFFKLGRTFQAEADQSSGMASEYLRSQAIVYYRAALDVVSSNSLAANQLGYVLLQQDRPLDAQQVLVASVQSNPDGPALQNLAEASRRIGDSAMQQWATQSLAILNAQIQPIPGPTTTVQVVDNSTFAALHPISVGPQPASQNPAARTAQVSQAIQ